MNNTESLYIQLPSVDTIRQYNVSDLLEEIENPKILEKMSPESKVFQTTIHICQLISINTKKFTTDEYLEYKDNTHSPYMLGNTHVTNGAMAIFSIATSSGLFKNKLDNSVTIFEFKKILDVLELNDNVDGKIGGYIRKFIERSMIMEYRKSGMVQVSQRLLTRFKKELRSEVFEFDNNKFSIKDNSHCEDIYKTPIYKKLKDEIREEKVYRELIHTVPLWPGNQAVISTQNIQQLLIDIVCIFNEVDFKLFFKEFKDRVQDWMMNTPLRYNSNTGIDDDEGNNLVLQEILSGDNLLEESTRFIYLEQEAISIVKLFNKTELFLIQQLLQNKSIAQISPLLNLGSSATGERIKKVREKLGKILIQSISNLNTSNYANDDYELTELLEVFNNEIKNRRIVPEIV